MKTSEIDTLLIHHDAIDDISLKRCILIFDHVYMIHPKENWHLIPGNVVKLNFGRMTIVPMEYGVLCDGETIEKREDRLINDFDYAYDKGTLKVLDPQARKFYGKYWLPLRLSFDFDTADESLLNAVKPLLRKEKKLKFSDGMIRGGFVSPSGIKVYPDIPKVPEIFTEEEEEYKFSMQSFSIIGKLNRSLAICGEYNLIPTFLNESLADSFVRKCELAKNNTENNVKKQFAESHRIELQSLQYLLFKISEHILPDEILKEIPVRELIIARNNTFHELHKLRRKMIAKIKVLTRSEFDENYFEEVNSFIEKEIKPAFEEYQTNFWSLMSKFSGYINTFALGTVGCAIGLMQSLPPIAVALLSGVSATVGPAVSNLSDYLVRKNKEKFHNSYSYFLNFHR
jgi:hypothetical protein